MKKLLALAACACLLGAAAPANYNAFGIAALQRLAAHQQDANVFISPVSIGIALAMAADGAAGSTRASLLHGLRVDAPNLAQANAALVASLRSNHDARVGIANAIWLRNDLPPRPRYVALLRDRYAARAQALHFGDPSAAAAINAWTRLHTLGLIDHLVDSTDPTDFAFLTNALAFEGNWSVPFEHNATSPQPFTDESGLKHNVPMMSRTGSFQTVDEPSFRALRLPYGSGGYAAYVLLPNGNNAAALVRALSASTFDHLARSAGPQYLRLLLPRFTATYETNLNGVLGSLGMGIAFSYAADFSPMHAPPPRLRIASVVHKAFVRVDEAGTVAAAATAVEVRTHGMRMLPPRSFIVNRPFVFALRDEHTGALLFIGVIRKLP
ncbi:MAG TPA: serpin family protein [Candidatus Tyrphobacter sp.]